MLNLTINDIKKLEDDLNITQHSIDYYKSLLKKVNEFLKSKKIKLDGITYNDTELLNNFSFDFKKLNTKINFLIDREVNLNNKLLEINKYLKEFQWKSK